MQTHDPAFDQFPNCTMCHREASQCTCPECPVCGTQGDPHCVDHVVSTATVKERSREECLRQGSHTWGKGIYARVCLRCGECRALPVKTTAH